MNNNEKAKINELRKQGYGYKKIAKELSITTSAARHACNASLDEEFLNGNCEQCGLKIKSIKGKKKKRFCSDKCRWLWWNNRQKKVNKKAYYTFRCKLCDKEFTSYGNNKRVYCSHDCYVKYKLKKGAGSYGTL